MLWNGVRRSGVVQYEVLKVRLHLKELPNSFFVLVDRRITALLRCPRLTIVTKIQIGRYGTTSETFGYKATIHMMRSCKRQNGLL